MSVAAWTQVPLGDVATPVDRAEVPAAGKRYRQIGVRLWGEGAYERESMDGAATQYGYLNRVEPDDIIVNKIWARHGAVSVVTPELADCWCSGEFPLFTADHSRLRSRWMYWLTKSPSFWTGCEDVSRGTTSKSRLRPEQFLRVRIPLPSPEEQDRIVATLDAAAARVAEAQRLCREIDEEADALCRSILSDPRHPTTPIPMRELVTLRPPDVDVKAAESYHFAGIYCFGKGMFRGQTRLGAEFSYDTLSRVRAGDFTYPKLMAWEGALCVVPPECDRLYVSTEYPVFEINTDRVLPDVLDVYFRSPEVWPKLSGTSKGTNVRRRRLNPQQFLNYVMPLPKREVQERVAEVRAKLAGVRSQHVGLATELEALLPAILDRAFKGELAGMGAATQSGRTFVAADSSVASTKGSMVAAKGSTAVVEGSTRAVKGSTKAVGPCFVPVEGSMTTVEGSTPIVEVSNTSIEGLQATVEGSSASRRTARTAESAGFTGSNTIQIWNIPEIAAIQAELVRRNGGSATLGRKKISKGAYLAAALLGAKQNPPPLRKAAGPFNTQGQNEVEAYATQAGWFRDSGLASGQRSSSRYRAGDRIAEAAAKAKGLVAARAADFERFVGVFVNWDSDTAELHATAHAAWNGLIAAEKPVTEAAIIETFFEWSEEKAKFKATQIRSALATLRFLGMEPNGGGPVVSGVGESNLFSSASR